VRAFRFRSATQIVETGQCLHIPSRVARQAVEIDRIGTVCVNAYVSTDDQYDSVALFDIRDAWLKAGFVDVDDLLGALRDSTASFVQDSAHRPLSSALSSHVVGRLDRIEDIAATFNESREGFSRRFVREVGMAPHALRIVERLNRGRSLLRVEKSIAAVAAETGFADQSHFGRLFLRTFGATPAAYSRG
jgi:AraC-like DNA-binding protein